MNRMTKMPLNYALTFACYNSVDYTKLCIDSMIKHGTPLDRLVVVDNGSTDETRAYLQTLPLGGRIFNPANLGCGVAWNQGALALQADWTIVMNNDVLVSAQWIEKLLHTAETLGLKVISPALIEGALDYDFEQFSMNASAHATRCVWQFINPYGWMSVIFSLCPNYWVMRTLCFFTS